MPQSPFRRQQRALRVSTFYVLRPLSQTTKSESTLFIKEEIGKIIRLQVQKAWIAYYNRIPEDSPSRSGLSRKKKRDAHGESNSSKEKLRRENSVCSICRESVHLRVDLSCKYTGYLRKKRRNELEKDKNHAKTMNSSFGGAPVFREAIKLHRSTWSQLR